MILYTIFTITVTLVAYALGSRVGYIKGWEQNDQWTQANYDRKKHDD